MNGDSGTAVNNSSTSQVFGSKYKHNLRTTTNYNIPQKYNEIIDILLSPQLELANVLCSIKLVKDKVPNAISIFDELIGFFEIHCNLKSSYLLKWAIDKEIECTANSATLFRGLSTATRLVSAFFKRIGSRYLKYLLQPFVLDLCSRNFSFEIDPDKVSKGMDIKSNLERLITISQQLLDKILDSASLCPPSICSILQYTQEKVEKRFPEMKTTVVGGFMFLRFICPAIVGPEIFGLINPQNSPKPDSRRGLVLVSKLLQNLANEMPFGVGIKEEYMAYLNRFITNNSKGIHVFFNVLPNININQQQTNSNSNINSNANNINTNNNGGGEDENGGGQKELSRQRSRSETPPLERIGHAQNLINQENNNIAEDDKHISEESVMTNLGIMINQLFENRDKIEAVLGESVDSDILKRFDAAMQALKSTQGKQHFVLPWNKKNKDKEGSGLGGNGMAITNVSSKLKNNKSALYNGGSMSNMRDVTDDDVQQAVQAAMVEFQNHYRHKFELKEIEVKSYIDEINHLKRELEEHRSRNNLMKKLRDELEVEKKKRRDAEQLLKKTLDKMGSSHDSEYLSREEESFSDLSSMTGDDEKQSTSSNNKKKKSASSTSLHGSVRRSDSSVNLLPNGPMALNASQQTTPSLTSPSVHHQPLAKSSSSQELDGTDSMKRSITNSSIADSPSVVNSGEGDSSTLSINNSSKEQAPKAQLKRSDSHDHTGESSSEYDAETEDRIIQACVDGELVEDEEGMDMLQFLKEVASINQIGGANGANNAKEQESDAKKKKSSNPFKNILRGNKKTKDPKGSISKGSIPSAALQQSKDISQAPVSELK